MLKQANWLSDYGRSIVYTSKYNSDHFGSSTGAPLPFLQVC